MNPISTTDNATSDAELAVKNKHRKPWKYFGYSKFSQFMASDNDFFMLRAFGRLSARVLLMLQDEIVELEAELADLDRSLEDPAATDVHNGSFRREASGERRDLLIKIDGKLRAYNELVLQHSELRMRPRVPKGDQESLKNWLFNHDDKAILPEEADFVNHSEDLFAIAPRSKTPLRRLLERFLHFRGSKVFRVAKKAGSEETVDENVHYNSDERIDTFVSVIITIFGLLMLVAPLWILGSVVPVKQRLAIITAFLVIFLCLVTFTTVAKPFETLGAAAA